MMAKSRITTLAGLRRKVRAMLVENEAKFADHKRAMNQNGNGQCMSSCEDALEYHFREGALEEVLRAAGGRA